jgi:hypothetical protein
MKRFAPETLIGPRDHALLRYSEESRGPGRLFLRAWHDGEEQQRRRGGGRAN